MILKAEYIEHYDKIKMKYKLQCVQRMGFNNASIFLEKNQITEIQFNILKNFNNNIFLKSGNRTAEPVEMDLEQLIQYNKGLLQLIGNEQVFVPPHYSQGRKTKIFYEHIEIQKRINNFKEKTVWKTI